MATYTHQSTTPNITIPPFSGLKIDYPPFRDAIISTATQASLTHEKGLLGVVIPTTEFISIHGEAFTPIPHPGPQPQPPTNADSQRTWDNYVYRNEQYMSQQK